MSYPSAGDMKVSDIKPLELVPVRSSDMKMPVEKYADWLEAIIDDNLDYITNTLANLPQHERYRYFNGYFTTADQESERVFRIHFRKNSEIQCQRPLMLAFIYGSRNVMAAMLEYGADPLVKEDNQDTILHSVASVAYSYPEIEPELAEMYAHFLGLLSFKQQKELLFAENEMGLRPLEDAAHKGCSLLVKQIFQTPGLYLIKEKTYGMWRYQWYDITCYETFDASSRRSKSPLAFIAFMTNRSLHRETTKELLYWNPMYHWYRIKVLANTPWLVLWAMCRFALCLLVMVIMVEKSNLLRQGGVPEDEALLYPNASFYYCSGYTVVYLRQDLLIGAAVFTCVCAGLGLLYDIGESIYIGAFRRPEYLRIQLKQGDMAISFWFHRVSQALFLSSVMLFAAKIARNNPMPVDVLSDVGRLFIIITAFASLLFFFEQLPQIGFYIIAIKRMLKDLFYFWILYMVCVAPFVLCFMAFMNTNSVQGCIEDFSSYLRSFYSMFLIMLNMLNLEQYQVKNAYVLYMTHMVFIFVVSILLVNFLIAVMTDSAVRVSRRKKTLLRLEKLHALFIVETRICWILKKYYMYMIQKLAVIQDERIYLLNIEQIARKK